MDYACGKRLGSGGDRRRGLSCVKGWKRVPHHRYSHGLAPGDLYPLGCIEGPLEITSRDKANRLLQAIDVIFHRFPNEIL
jgi:hypothetical protein